MEEKLVITNETKQGYLLLHVSGRIDGYWSKMLDEALDSAIRAGDQNIALDLEEVEYLSSLGIRIFVKYVKLFKSIDGSFGITKASQNVHSILDMVGLDSMLKWQEPKKTSQETENPSACKVENEGFCFKSQSLSEKPAENLEEKLLKCTLVGHPEKLFNSSFTENDFKSVKFGKGKYGLGLGAFGTGYKDCEGRFGEFVAAGEAVAYMPSGKINSPDYLVTAGTLIPEINLLYGILFEGEFSRFIRFTPLTPGKRLPFSSIINTISSLTGYESFAMIMVGESAGIVGASLHKSPVLSKTGENPLGYPEVKESVNFTTEPEFRGSVALTTGIVTKKKGGDIARFTRPSAEGGELRQHMHSAIFSYFPLSKSDQDLYKTVFSLFEDDKIDSVMHLLNDQRETVGIGESEFFQGICWVGPLDL